MHIERLVVKIEINGLGIMQEAMEKPLQKILHRI